MPGIKSNKCKGLGDKNKLEHISDREEANGIGACE